MLSSETKVVTYVNKKGERSTYPLNSAMESANPFFISSLLYFVLVAAAAAADADDDAMAW